MLKDLAGHDVRSLRKCVSAGETLPAATFNAWETGDGHSVDGRHWFH